MTFWLNLTWDWRQFITDATAPSTSRKIKGELCQQHSLELCVEDLPRNVDNLKEYGIPTLLLDYHWNQHVPEGPLVIRVKDWPEITEKVRGIVRK
jgi:hypothetical protein